MKKALRRLRRGGRSPQAIVTPTVQFSAEPESNESAGVSVERAAADGREISSVEGVKSTGGENGKGANVIIKKTIDADWDTPAFPVFCLCKPPKEYWESWERCGKLFNVNWVEIYSNAESRDQLLDDLTAGLPDEDERRYPFVAGGHSEIAGYWQRVVRPKLDSVDWEPFARDTFFIVREKHLEFTDPCPKVELWSVAPDYADDPNTELLQPKIYPGFIAGLLHTIHATDAMTATPDEASNSKEEAMSSTPPFIFKIDLEESSKGTRKLYRPATLAEARQAKKRALKLKPQRKGDYVVDEESDEARWMMLCSVKEANSVGHTFRVLDTFSRKKGLAVAFSTNPSKEYTEQHEKEKREGHFRVLKPADLKRQADAEEKAKAEELSKRKREQREREQRDRDPETHDDLD